MHLGDEFRPSATIVYPPFKKGRYLEEAFYEFYEQHGDRVYIPVFWTNLQTDSEFSSKKEQLQETLTEWFASFPPEQKYFAVVQHDDGIPFTIPKDTLVFGACTGDIPLPLIYEDTDCTLERIEQVPFNEKGYLASFMGTATHSVRTRMIESKGPWFICTNDQWTNDVSKSKADKYIDIVKESKFTLSPRGYGRSSFRFFEAFKLGSIPVYIYDDIEWLPYKELIDYTRFCISININDLDQLQSKLESIGEEDYTKYIESYHRIKHMFTMDGMNNYIVDTLSKGTPLALKLTPREGVSTV